MLLLRFDKWAHLLSSALFAFAAILIAGVNLYALAIAVEALLGWPQWVAIVVVGAFVLAYITLGGLSSAIYNEVLQFFVILAALIPIVVLGLKKVGGWDGLTDSLTKTHGADFGIIGIPSDQGANFVSAIAGFAAGAVVMVVVSPFTAPKPAEELQGLVYGTRSPGMSETPAAGDVAWYRRPALLGWGAVILAAACYIPFSF